MEVAFLIWMYLSLGSLLYNLVNFGSIVLVIGGAVFSFFGFFTYIDEGSEVFKEMRDGIWRLLKVPTWIYMVVALLYSFYPSKTDLGYIFGGTALYHTVSTEEAQKLPNNVLKAMNKILEDINNEEDN